MPLDPRLPLDAGSSAKSAKTGITLVEVKTESDHRFREAYQKRSVSKQSCTAWIGLSRCPILIVGWSGLLLLCIPCIGCCGYLGLA